MIHTIAYSLHDLLPYVNWIYFFHAWGMAPRFAQIADVHDCPACRRSWVERMGADDRLQATEAEKLQRDAVAMVRELDGKHTVYARFGLFPAWSEEDDIVVVTSEENNNNKSEKGKCARQTVRLPFLRQQKVKRQDAPFLCLADFIAPQGTYPDIETVFPESSCGEIRPRGTALGVFATAVEERMEELYQSDDYRHLLVQTICDRMAEAAAEKMHEEVRRYYWGYAPDEKYTAKELFSEQYEGRRPAVGYPSMPDQSFNFLIDRLIGMKEIGISLTSNGMMHPHAAVSGLMFDHPALRHFAVGTIDEQQMLDYSQRRGWEEGEALKYLAANLNT